MMDAMLKAAGLTNVTAAPGYSQLRLEDIVASNPRPWCSASSSAQPTPWSTGVWDGTE